MGKLQIVVGGQFGSEGKGALAAWLVRREWRSVLAIRVAGPNAGHTAYDDNGVEFKLQQLPVASIVTPHIPGQIAVAIAAGSEIDERVLETEKLNIFSHGHIPTIFIDAQATIIEPHHSALEHGNQEAKGLFYDELKVPAHGEAGLTKRIGSTGKGVGAARASRLMREARIWGTDAGGVNVAERASTHLARGGMVQIEGTQGYGLGLHAGFYPFCTSSDCRAIDFLSMVGLSPWANFIEKVEVWVALRTFPIRVAGNSGPLRNEISWMDLGIPAEFTTVTKKMRRVGEFDSVLADEAISANGGRTAKIALMFGDYVAPQIRGVKGPLIRKDHPWLQAWERDILGYEISAVGTGPQTIAEVVD